jgi:hypothetical protein
MELVPDPEMMLALAGTVHVYEFAPVIGATEYVCTELLHTPVIFPLMLPGADGIVVIAVSCLQKTAL